MLWIAEQQKARAELEQLRQVRVVLSEDLAKHAAQLKSTGALPPEDLLDQLLNYRSRLLTLSAGLAMGATPSQDSANSPAVSLDTVQLVLDQREVAQRCEMVLGPILQLSHADDPVFAPLAQCQAQASRILQEIQASVNAPSNLTGVDKVLEPFEALLKLVQSDSEISDDDWTAFQEQVTATWGRALSTALARGKIRSASQPAQQPILEVKCVPVPVLEAVIATVAEPAVTVGKPSETIAEPEIDDTPGIILDPEFHDDAADVDADDDVDSVFDTQHDMVFDAVGKPGAERAPSRRLRTMELKLLSDEPYQWMRPQPTRASAAKTETTPNDVITDLARRALQAESPTRNSNISELIFQLLWNDRMGAAYHLARSVEGQSSADSDVPPTWLLHALTLSRQLCYSNGEMARLIEQDLEHFEPELLESDKPLQDAANGFFVRAAALLPALLTASPAAVQVIKSFRISPGLSHLYNYCGRILNYGQQLQGQAADLFTPDCDHGRWTAAMTELQQEVENWLPDTANRYCAATKAPQFYFNPHWTLTAGTSVRHEVATKRWGKWQEVLRIVHRLLAPVRVADQLGRNWVKSEVERLNRTMELEANANLADLESRTTEALLFPEEAMLTVIREAIDLANRWLRLCAARPDQGRTLMSRDAEVLRDEILERTDGVVAELAAYSEAHDALCVKASIACLCRTIEHLRMIFSPHSTLPLRESAPRQVLSSELLEIPHLEFDAQGLPTLAADELETVLLTFLSGASRDQFEKLKYRVTACILESNARQHAEKLEALGPRRTAEVSDSCWE